MIQEDDAFRRAICEMPYDDTPRLVYADWLQERGIEARAEFIRLQCRLAQSAGDDPDRAAMIKRERKLLQKNRHCWQKEVSWQLRQYPFVRGFIQPDCSCHLDRFCDLIAEFGLATPLWKLNLDLTRQTLPDTLEREELAQVGSLRIRQFHRSDSIPWELASCPYLYHVREFSLKHFTLRDEWIDKIITIGTFPQLRALTLTFCQITPAGVDRICESEYWPQLRELNLTGNSIGPDGTALLARYGLPAPLRELNLRHCAIGDSGVELLMQSESIKGLRTLTLARNQITDTGAIALSLCPHLEGLRELDLSGNTISVSGARALAESPYLTNLQRLDVSSNRLTGFHEARRLLRDRFQDRVTM